MRTTLNKTRAYLWPAPGHSTHARIVDSTRWRITRVFAYPILAGVAVVVFVGLTNADLLHREYTSDGVQVMEVR